LNLNTVPTKGNLMAAKSSLALARQGYELMDKKRNILIREIMDLTEKAELIQHEIDKTFTDAYAALEKANIELGIKNVETFAFNVPPEQDIHIKTRSVMGTEIPLVKHKEEVQNQRCFMGSKPDGSYVRSNSRSYSKILNYRKLRRIQYMVCTYLTIDCNACKFILSKTVR